MAWHLYGRMTAQATLDHITNMLTQRPHKNVIAYLFKKKINIKLRP